METRDADDGIYRNFVRLVAVLCLQQPSIRKINPLRKLCGQTPLANDRIQADET